MKIMKRYLSIIPSFALVAMLFAGCDNGLDEYPSDAPIPAPSDKFTTHIRFVSRLNNEPIAGSDYDAFDAYMTGTSENQHEEWLTILDRADNGNLPAVMQTALNARRWTAFAFNRIASNTSYQGSMLFFNDCLRTGAKGVSLGSGSSVTSVTVPMTGIRTDKKDDVVMGTTPVSFNVNFLTARFDTAEQIAAFGGETGVLHAFYEANVAVIMVGTVRNELFGQLEAAAQSASRSYLLKVSSVSVGSQYTIFMLSEERFWGLNGVEKQTLSSGIDAYNIGIMW